MPGKPGRISDKCRRTINPTRDDIIWSAGFFEGEGHAGGNWSKGGYSWLVKVSIPQRDPTTLYWLRERFGGTVSPPSSKVHVGHLGRPCYTWNASGPNARGFLQTIYGLCTPRRQEQMRKALGVGEFTEVIRVGKDNNRENRAKLCRNKCL